MATTILGLNNAKAVGNTLSATTDWNSIVDDAEWIAGGYLTLSVAGGAGDTTLTAAQYEIHVLILTGALTGNRTVTFPTTHAGRRWLVYNNTSGAFTLTMQTAAGSSVVITQGYAALIACDGSGIIRLGPDTAVTSASSVAVTSPRVVTGINDTNGNELMKVTATASAVNEVTLANAATGSGPSIASTGDDANIDLTVKPKGTGGLGLSLSGGKVGFFGVTNVVRATAYTQTYLTADKTHANPTATSLTDNTGGTANTTLEALADGTVWANDVASVRNNFADLAASDNKLIVDLADLKQLVNSVIDDLQAYGLLQ